VIDHGFLGRGRNCLFPIIAQSPRKTSKTGIISGGGVPSLDDECSGVLSSRTFMADGNVIGALRLVISEQQGDQEGFLPEFILSLAEGVEMTIRVFTVFSMIGAS
jgi:hypothetical protein